MSRERKNSTAWAKHMQVTCCLPVSTSSHLISMQRNLQQLLLLPDSAIKGIQTERQKQNLPSSASFAEKKKTDAPCPLWGTGSRQGEASCKFMGHLLVTLTNRSQDNTSFVIHQKSASHFQQKLTSFHPPSISMLKSTKSPEQS